MEKRKGLLDLVRWCSLPTRPSELFQILKTIRDDELLLASTQLKGSVGRIAWAEVARRFGYFDFDISVTTGVGTLDVSLDAKALPVHDNPIFGMA